MPRFSLRDLFWLTLVLGMALGWAANRRQWIGKVIDAENWEYIAVSLKQRMEIDGWTFTTYPHAIQGDKGGESFALHSQGLGETAAFGTKVETE